MKKAKKQNTVIGLGIPNESLHFLSVIEGCKKLCAYCLSNKIRTKAGWFIYTKFKCNYCNVPLCQGRSGRLCHLLYHKHMTGSFADAVEDKEDSKPLPDHLLFPKTENFADPEEGELPDQERLAARRKHPRKGRVLPIQFMPDSNNELIDLESVNEEDDDLLGPFLYDETGIEPEGSDKPI